MLILTRDIAYMIIGVFNPFNHLKRWSCNAYGNEELDIYKLYYVNTSDPTKCVVNFGHWY